ncbi:hypothetical protein [Dactylosporangium sp. NPDC005555]|uniref:hypothetical protein n=1 Tax=Dactylosporangium sp. NPDC005555 TaxID=3154889 RepID=UPI0033AD528B
MRATASRVAAMPVAPQPDLDLDVRTLRSWLAVDEDGDPVLVLKDDDVTVVVDFGFGGEWDLAIRAAEGLGDTALAYAARLREVRATQEAIHQMSSAQKEGPAENKEEPCE